MPGGRPSKLTPDVQARILQAIAAGAYVETAAAYAGISKDSYYEWMARGESASADDPAERPYIEFSDAIKKATAEVEVLALLEVQMGGPRWASRGWWLERRFPRKWGRMKREDTGDEKPPQPNRRIEWVLGEKPPPPPKKDGDLDEPPAAAPVPVAR